MGGVLHHNVLNNSRLWVCNTDKKMPTRYTFVILLKSLWKIVLLGSMLVLVACYFHSLDQENQERQWDFMNNVRGSFIFKYLFLKTLFLFVQISIEIFLENVLFSLFIWIFTTEIIGWIKFSWVMCLYSYTVFIYAYIIHSFTFM